MHIRSVYIFSEYLQKKHEVSLLPHTSSRQNNNDIYQSWLCKQLHDAQKKNSLANYFVDLVLWIWHTLFAASGVPLKMRTADSGKKYRVWNVLLVHPLSKVTMATDRKSCTINVIPQISKLFTSSFVNYPCRRCSQIHSMKPSGRHTDTRQIQW